MKRDLLVLSLCFFLVAGVLLVGVREVVPASMTAAKSSEVTLILDAGHGGEDGGASSAGGDKESEINLAIVLKMEALLAFCGTETQLTRRVDVSLHDSTSETIREKKVSDLKNRVEMVNSASNAMLVSVHQNHFTDPRYDGAQVFYGAGDVSRQWGEYTQEMLRSLLDPKNGRKAKLISDSIYLFDHISCPAILVECGFLSNGEEASLLMTDSYQRKIAVALAGACLHQLQTLERLSGGG